MALLQLRSAHSMKMICALLGVAGCAGERTVTAAATQFTLSIHVTPPVSFAAVASAISWSAGSVPGATVIATRIVSGSSGSTVADTVIADAAGIARFRNLAFGTYSVAASRSLSQAEQALAGQTLGSAIAFTGVVTVSLGTTDALEASLPLVAVDRGSLLFSEIFPSTLFNESKGLLYYHGNYVRIYNNSDTTIALAGKLFINAFPGWYDYLPTNTCSTWASLTRDPAGIWAQLIYRFPPIARALRPGETALLVTDAIDHRPFGLGDPGYFDFSHADFEFRGAKDVDNPLVPDMISVGPRDGGLGDGHGWSVFESRPILALAMPLNLDTLPKQFNAVWDGGSSLVRIPKAALLDVVSSAFTNAYSSSPCPSSLVPAIDAAEAQLLRGGGTLSMHRRVSQTLPSGRMILQWTRSSAADWIAAPGTPFAVP